MAKINPFHLLTASISVLLLLPFWLQDGMFSDGTLYAAISKNMAEGLGSFWQPSYSFEASKAFYEQPPLGFWLQSLFFRLLGNGLFTERIYCALTYIVACSLLVFLWKQEKNNEKSFTWLPILLYTITPLVFWTYRHNMLENTMLLFDLSAIIAFISISGSSRKDVFYFLGGNLMVFFAALTKGFVGLFPLGFFFLQYLVLGSISFKTMFIRSFLAVFLLIISFGLLFCFSPSAFSFCSQYFDIQVLRSIKGERELSEGGNHLLLLRGLVFELIPMLIPLILLWIINQFKKPKTHLKGNFRLSFFWITVGLSASLPMLISPKQHGYYLVPSFPYFALAISQLIAPNLVQMQSFFNSRKWILLSSGLLLMSFLFGFTFLKKVSRDRAMIHDIHLLEKKYNPRTVFGLDSVYCELYSLQSYMLRYGQLETAFKDKNRALFLSAKSTDLSHEGYTEDKTLDLLYLRLWKK